MILRLFWTNFFLSETPKIGYNFEQKWGKRQDKLFSIPKDRKRAWDQAGQGFERGKAWHRLGSNYFTWEHSKGSRKGK